MTDDDKIKVKVEATDEIENQEEEEDRWVPDLIETATGEDVGVHMLSLQQGRLMIMMLIRLDDLVGQSKPQQDWLHKLEDVWETFKEQQSKWTTLDIWQSWIMLKLQQQ